MSSKKIDEIAIFARVGYEALETCGKDDKPYKWRHVVYTGFNEAFRSCFPDKDPRTELDRLQREGKIKVAVAKGGATFVLEDALKQPLTSAEERVAQRMREFFDGFKTKRAEAKAERERRKKPEPTPLHIEAAQLIAEGKIGEAMTLLGR